jgi:hypothetical protein
MIRIETELFISHPPEKIWAALMDYENYPTWNPFIKQISGDKCFGGKLKIKVNDPAKIGKSPNIKTYSFSPKIMSYEENKFFAWKGIFLFPKLFDGVHYIRLTPAGAGTLLVHGEAFSGLLVDIFGKKFFKDYAIGFAAMNIALAKYLG